MSRNTVAQLTQLAVDALGSFPVRKAADRVFGDRLRVLAYHGIADPERFDAQMTELRRRYRPVTASEVVQHLGRGAPLPRNAAWVTFDDAHPTVVSAAAPVLARHGVSATLFICPGLIDTDEPYWWDVVAAVAPPEDRSVLLSELKQVDDTARRRRIGELQRAAREDFGSSIRGAQVTSEELRRWIGAGHSIGNHSWDHPCLDRCARTEARLQVRRAHDWIQEFEPGAPKLFAYPNGNWSVEVEAELEDLGYDVGLLFDHRIAGRVPDRLRLSRLRVDSDADLRRFRAIVSGAHSAAFHVGRSR